MAKKQTKKYTRRTSVSAQSAKSETVATTAVSAQSVKTPRVSRRVVEDSDFNPDYTLIIQDLKRIGILAASFFAILVILSFFL